MLPGMSPTARVLAAAAAGFVIALPAAAWADTNATITSGDVPATAEEATRMCAPSLGGGPFPGQDVWVFALPQIARDFVSITASFSTDADLAIDATRSAPADGGIADESGTSRGWILAPAGWTLITATAVVTSVGHDSGGGVSFNLIHACPAAGQTSGPSPSRTAGPSPSASATAPTRPSAAVIPLGNPGGSPSVTPFGDATPIPSAESPSAGGGGGGTPKPSTGPETGGSAQRIAGGFLLGGGSVLAAIAGAGLLILMVRRRRDFA